MHVGVGHMGRHPNTWGCPNRRKALNPPITCRYPQNMQMHRGVLGPYGGCLNIWGHGGVGSIQMYGGIETYGVIQSYGGTKTPPKCKTHLPLRKMGKPLFKAKFLHVRSLGKYLENLQTTLGMNPHQIYP